MNLNKNNIYSILILIAGILPCHSLSNRAWAKKSVELRDSSSSLTPLFVYSSERMTSFTPWANQLELSSRYVSTIRAQNLSKQTAEERIIRQQLSFDKLDILDDFDRYILAAAVNPKHDSNPLFDSWLSLSHTWGHGSSGYILNARQMPKAKYWIHRRFKNYGTPEMLATIKAGTQYLREKFPDAPPVIIGDLSKRYGGHFPPHLSHQSGRDADIGYFIRGPYSHKLKGLTLVNRRTIDVAKTWAFLSGMLKTGLIESAFIDYQLQKVLYRHAKKEGEWSETELKKVFSYPLWKGKVISHLRGHSDHMHVRFKAPLSEQAALAYMKDHGRRRFRPRRVYTQAKKGENLIRMAKRFRVSWRTLMRWNRLSKSQARKPLSRKRKYVVGYYTPYYARSIKFPLPKHSKDLNEALSQREYVDSEKVK